MKIYIGPYTRWWHPQQLLLPIKYIFGITDANYYGEYVKGAEDKKGLIPWFEDTIIGAWLKRKSYKTEQKEKIHIDNWDVWSFDNTLAKIIEPMLRIRKEKGHGAPSVDDEDVPELFRRPVTDLTKEWDTDINWFLRFDWLLAELIWTFAQFNNPDRESQFYSGKSDWIFEKTENSDYSTLITGPNHSFKIDTEAQKLYEDRIANGLRLFSKYFQGLWD